MLELFLRSLEKIIPKRVYKFFQPAYHYLLALLGALIYRFPGKELPVIFVTGTKGKSSVVEMLNAVFEAAGKKTAVLGTIRFKIGEKNTRNLRKMTIPGRFFVQKFLRDAVAANCDIAIVEMTSEGAKQFRHLFIDADALVFTNLSPEHIESHGSYEQYRDAKLSIARLLARSSKPSRFMVANKDDKESALFLSTPGLTPVTYSLSRITSLNETDAGSTFVFENERFHIHLPGKFNVSNALGAIVCAHLFGISFQDARKGLENLKEIPGRAQEVSRGQPFKVVIDYAHTTESLKNIYSAYPNHKKICVLGNTGGGRDKWKRPEMAKIAEHSCDWVILANEDPYDEDPGKILAEMEEGFEKDHHERILNRREAINAALLRARKEQVPTAVIITGKGTDPYIMGPNGTKEVWDERTVAEEELEKILSIK